jgi:hypothetical protein
LTVELRLFGIAGKGGHPKNPFHPNCHNPERKHKKTYYTMAPIVKIDGCVESWVEGGNDVIIKMIDIELTHPNYPNPK